MSGLASSGGSSGISIDDSQVNYNVPGTYTVTINAYDSSGNLTSQTYQVTVPATSGTAVHLGLLVNSGTSGSSDATNTGPTLTGAPTLNSSGTGIDVSGLASSGGGSGISIDDSQVNYNVPGTYTVTINAYDSSGNLTSQSYQVTVPATSGTSGTIWNQSALLVHPVLLVPQPAPP